MDRNRLLETLKGLRLFDDVLMTVAFDGQTGCADQILDAVFGKDVMKTVLRERVQNLKGEVKGEKDMSSVLDALIKDSKDEAMREVAQKMLAKGTNTFEEIVELTGVPAEEIRAMQAALVE